MCQPDTKKRTQIQKSQTHNGRHGSPPLERKHGKKVLGQIVDHAERPLGPAQRDQILPINIALDKARILDHLAQLHIVDHFHAQRTIRTDPLID